MRKVEVDTPIDDSYNRLGNKLDGIYKNVDSKEGGFEIYDKIGNKLDGAYKKQQFISEQELFETKIN